METCWGDRLRHRRRSWHAGWVRHPGVVSDNLPAFESEAKSAVEHIIKTVQGQIGIATSVFEKIIPRVTSPDINVLQWLMECCAIILNQWKIGRDAVIHYKWMRCWEYNA